MTIDFPGVTRRSLAWMILLLVCASGGGWARRVVEQEPTRIAPPRAVTMRPEIVGSYGIVALSTPGGDSQDQQILNVLLNVLGPYSMSTGVVAVGVDPKTGALRGGADPRRERYIFGW